MAKQQVNARLSEEGVLRLDRLCQQMATALGFPVSQADAIEAALIELEKKYPPPAQEALPQALAPTPTELGPKRARKKKAPKEEGGNP